MVTAGLAMGNMGLGLFRPWKREFSGFENIPTEVRKRRALLQTQDFLLFCFFSKSLSGRAQSIHMAPPEFPSKWANRQTFMKKILTGLFKQNII